MLETENADPVGLNGVGVYLGDYLIYLLHHVRRRRDDQAIGGDVRHYLRHWHSLCNCFFSLGMRCGNYLRSDGGLYRFSQVGGLGVFQFDDANDACFGIFRFGDVHAGD